LAAAILLFVSWLGAQELTTHYGRKPPADKGPRALGLIQLSSKGDKGRIVPIAIMLDGKFYDASSYKARPVPMALDFGIVYEGFRTGVSQGIFTITQPGQLNHEWIAEGTWLTAGAVAAQKRKKYSPPKIEDEDNNGPPVLHRRFPKEDSDAGTKSDSGNKDKNEDQKSASAPAPSTSSSPSPPANAPNSPTSPDSSKTAPAPDTAKTSAPPPAKASTPHEPVEDPNRPRLRRGKPESTVQRGTYATFDVWPEVTPNTTAAGVAKSDVNAVNSAAASPPVVFIPAISDAGGPDPRPYTYDLKPAEEAIYRNKMLELAAAQVVARSGAAPKDATGAAKSAAGRAAAKAGATLPKPNFDDVRLRIFDLSSSNEPVLVFSAKTSSPAASASASATPPKEITLIARTNLEGELQKLFFSQTDSQHLDVTPRMELIDAVDADGDGRGELLFRQTSDAGGSYAIYRVTADGLWPLFEGTP